MPKGKRKPRKRKVYIAPKPGEPKLWVKVRRIDVEILKYRDVGINKFLFPYNRFKTPSACVVTPVYVNIVSNVRWDNRNLEDILTVTNDVYRTTIVTLKLKPNCKFPLQCIHPTFYVGNYKVTIFVGSNYPKGDVGDLRGHKADPEAINLINSIINDYVGIVILSDDKAVCIWKMEEDIYAFSPDGVSRHQDLPILAKSKEIKSILRFILQNATGSYGLYSIKLLNKLQIKQSLHEILHDAESRIDECYKPTETEAVEEPESPAEKPATPTAEKINIADVIQQVPLAFNTDYKYISDVRGILRGSNYVKEPEKLFYTVIACALYLHHIPSYIWTAESMGEIIGLGKNIHEMNVDREDQVELQAKIEYPVSFGKNNLNIDFEKVIYGEITTKKPEVLPIAHGIRKFFEIYDTGLIQGPQLVLIWQERGFYFYYDPKERDQMGRKWTRALSDDPKKGSSCVQWFQNPNDLAESYLNTLAYKHKRDPYKILSLHIYENKFMNVAEDWGNWVGFGADMWALVGRQNICHYIGTVMDDKGELKDDMSVEAKTFATAIGDLIYSLIVPEIDWNTETIEQMFIYGMDFIKAVLSNQLGANDFNLSYLQYSTILRDKRIVMLSDAKFVTGALRMDPPEADVLSTELKLSSGIEKFFHRNRFGVLQVKQISIPIWMTKSHFYMLYPYEKCSARFLQCHSDPKGIIPANGYGYALRFKYHRDLSTMLASMMDFPDSEKYCIHNFIIEVFDAEQRPLYNFTPYETKSAMLRSLNDFHEGYDGFQIRADRQNLAVLMVSIGLTKLNNPAKWSSEDLNDIIKMGDRIFCNLIMNDPECKGVDYCIGWNDITLIIGMNKFAFTKNTIYGIFEFPEEPIVEEQEKEEEQEEENLPEEEEDEEEATDDKKQKELPVLVQLPSNDLEGVLKKWTEDNAEAEAVIESGFFNVSIWSKDGLFYVFDSKASGPKGELTQKRLEIGKDKANNFAPVRSSKYYNALPNEGSAYVVWFEEFQPFLEHIKSKLPKDYWQQEFALHEIKLTNTTPPPPEIPVSSKPGFKALSPGKSIIRGTISQNDLMFVHKDKQEAANCIATLAFALVSSTQKWSQTLLDIILKYGDRLYTKSLQAIDQSDPEVACLVKLSLSHIVKSFKIYKIRFDWDISPPLNDMLRVSQLKPVLGKMETIEKKKGYIIICKGVTNTIWKAEGQIFVFEPKGSDPNGKLLAAGYASVFRLSKPELLYDFLISKFGTIDGPNTFELYTVTIKSTTPKVLEVSPEDLEKLNFAAKIPKSHEMFMDYKDKPDMKVLKFLLPEERVAENLACLASLVYSRLQYVELWDYNVFERIFFLAKYLYNKAACESNSCQKSYSLDEINPNFAVDNNIMCHVILQRPYQGLVTTSGKAQAMSITMKNALSLFFKECQYCVVQANGKFFALWHETEKFYLFEVNPSQNECFVVSGPSLEVMNEIIMDDSKNINLNWYEIWSVQVVTIPVKSTLCSSHDTYAPKKIAPSDYPLSSYKQQCYYYDYVSRRVERLPTEPRTDFTCLPEGVEILTTTDLRNLSTFEGTVDYFPILQTSCIIAAGMAHLTNPILWTKSILEEILNAGVNLFVSSLAMKRINNFQITDLDRVFYLANTRLEISPLVPALECAEKRNLLTVLTFVLRKYKTAYVITDDFCFTLIMEQNGVFLYYPGSILPLCDEMPCGSSCLLKFENLDSLLDKMLGNGKITSTENVFMGPIVVYMK